MTRSETNKRKLFNDPVYGFTSIPHGIIFDLIEHPYYQRLRRISQLGLSHYVYPGALHTRFHHALGAMYLMTQAIETLKSKISFFFIYLNVYPLIIMLLHVLIMDVIFLLPTMSILHT